MKTIQATGPVDYNEWTEHIHKTVRERAYPIPVRPLQMKMPMEHMVLDHVNDLYRYHFKGNQLIWTRIGSAHIERKTP